MNEGEKKATKGHRSTGYQSCMVSKLYLLEAVGVKSAESVAYLIVKQKNIWLKEEMKEERKAEEK